MSFFNYILITIAFMIKFLSESQGYQLKLRKLSLMKIKTRILRQKKKPTIPGSEMLCKSSLRQLLVTLSNSMSNQLIPSKTSKLRSKTNYKLLQIDKCSSMINGYFQTTGLFLTTTSNAALLSITLTKFNEVLNYTVNLILVLIFNNSLFLLIQSVFKLLNLCFRFVIIIQTFIFIKL